MNDYFLKQSSGGNNVRVLKQLLNAHSQVTNSNLKSNNLFCSATATSVREFQNSNKIASTGIMNEQSWSALGTDIIRQKGIPYLKIMTLNNPTLLFLLTGVMIAPPNTSNFLPDFDVLWKNHNGDNNTYVIPGTKDYPPNFENQCAINMAYSLQKSGVNMSSYQGKTVQITENNKKMNLAAVIYQLANWVIPYFGNGYGGIHSPFSEKNSIWKEENVIYSQNHNLDVFNYDQNLLNLVKNKRGIIILWDFWMNGKNLGGHIDLWDGVIMKLKRGGNDEILRARKLYFIPLW